jgi:hypothetical protein
MPARSRLTRDQTWHRIVLRLNSSVPLGGKRRRARRCADTASDRQLPLEGASPWLVSGTVASGASVAFRLRRLSGVLRAFVAGREGRLRVAPTQTFFKPATSPLGGKRASRDCFGNDRSSRHSRHSIASAKIAFIALSGRRVSRKFQESPLARILSGRLSGSTSGRRTPSLRYS